jgi:phosphate starvation-inducible protein PhoH
MSTRKRSINSPSVENSLSKIYLKESQQSYVDTIIKNQVTFCYGPAGTSKTFSACYAAIKLLKEKKIKRIIRWI